jgi:peptide alpha-N-acetyltransferase
LHRADRNYLEAIKAYKQALRIDADNLQILRDLSLLQIQMRDLAGFVVTRNSILNLKPTIQQHWLAFALARKMVDDTQGALQVIDIYLGTLVEGSPELSRNYEPSEMQMYKNWLLLELKDYKEALEHLEKVERIVVDRSGWLWHKATCHYHLGEYDKCKKTLEQMMHRGMTEDYRIHTAYMCAVLERNDVADDWGTWTGMNTLATMLVLNEDQRRLLLQLYCNDLKESFPKSPAIQRIPITLLEGEEWLQALNVYCQKGLVKGVPSLAHDLSSFLLHPVNGRYKQLKDPVDVKNDWKYEKLCVLADSYISNLESSSRFSETDEEAQPPSTIFWAWYLRAGLHEIAAEYSQGLAYLTKCLDHTPTAVDVYEMRARFLKAAGDLSAAVDAIDKGRELDQQDRYMNNMTTKYMLQAGDPETALSRIGLFISKEDGPEKNLYDMQCSWYELELADCLARQEQWGRSLKKYGMSHTHVCYGFVSVDFPHLILYIDAVLKHFEDIHEDQFDFHSYCIRKVTLRAYSDVLQWEDNLWGQPYYRRAAEGTMRIYLHLQDNPSLTKEFEEPDYSGMSAAEKKKAKAIARKKKKAAEKKAADETEDNKPTDDDPDGLEYLKKNYLEECQKLSAVLSKHAPGQISTWICQYDVAVRRGKAAMALQVRGFSGCCRTLNISRPKRRAFRPF